jgi:hypothetical protein
MGRHCDTFASATQLLQYFLSDVIFVSIDVQAGRNIQSNFKLGPMSQMGIATLDTRQITQTGSNIISSQHLVSGDPLYCTKSNKFFLFGTSESHDSDRELLKKKLKESLYQEDREDPKRFRKIILVTHGVHEEMGILENLGFDLDNTTQIVRVLDTQCIAKTVLQLHKSLKLGVLLRELNCPFGYLHNAGNDAHYTLRALLLFGSKGMPGYGISCE